MKREFIWAFLVIVVIAGVAPAWGKIIRVPQEYVTPGDAVNMAINGDEIIISPGNYNGFDYGGLQLNIHSIDPTNPDIVGKTVINGRVALTGLSNGYSRLAGFTITGSELSGVGGGNANSIVEYNHIYDNLGAHPMSGWPYTGGGIAGCQGTIRNNLIDSNDADFGGGLYQCNGLIENNIIVRNRATGIIWNGQGAGAALYDCHGTIRNNTIAENVTLFVNPDTDPMTRTWAGGGLANCSGAAIYNNIIWVSDPDMTPEYSLCAPPRYCCIKGWSGGGTGNISSDPKFVKSAFETYMSQPTLTGLDWHLTSSSLCIDAGLSTATLPRLDFDGLPRGLRGATNLGRGDGSGVDIGAYEALPEPVAVWLPGGGPDTLRHGDALSVAWRCLAPAGTDLRLRLYRGGQYYGDLGIFRSATGAATSTVTLPFPLATGDAYAIRGISLLSNSYSAMTGDFAVQGYTSNAVPAAIWRNYE